MKLTLNIEPGLINRIKDVAKRRNTSVSKIAENIFKKEIEIENKPFRIKSEDELSAWIKSLVAVDQAIPDFDHKAEYRNHLDEKYGK